MNKNKYFYIQFLGNCTQEPDIRVHVSEGLTKSRLDDWEEALNLIQDDYGNKHDDDFSDFDIKEAIKSAAEILNIEFDYPKVDYTIYI